MTVCECVCVVLYVVIIIIIIIMYKIDVCGLVLYSFGVTLLLNEPLPFPLLRSGLQH